MMTMKELINRCKEDGNHFFDERTMEFWNSRVESELFGDYFITSEDNFDRTRKMYSVRKFNRDYTCVSDMIQTVVFQAFDSYDEAFSYLQVYANDECEEDYEPEIKVLFVPVGKSPEVKTIVNELKPMQELVDGYIEVLGVDMSCSIVCNEEGKLLGLRPNRIAMRNGMPIDVIAGDFFITADNPETGDFISLTDEQIDYFTKLYQ